MLSYTSTRGISSGPPRIGSRTGFPSRGPSRPGRAFYLLPSETKAVRRGVSPSHAPRGRPRKAPHRRKTPEQHESVQAFQHRPDSVILELQKQSSCALELRTENRNGVGPDSTSRTRQTFVRKSRSSLTRRQTGPTRHANQSG